MFVDKVQVTLQAGDGGNGAVSFRREKFVDHGGPDGGDGGNGGDAILVASSNQDTLASFRYKKLIKAGDGQAGSKRRRHGKSGHNLVTRVPVGTVISQGNETIGDLTKDGQQVVIAKGGKGGFGNAHFVSSRRQAPRLAEKGEKGDKIEAVLELKMIADVGLVGLPNAGKSTLLASVSHARPEIADYPFTTLHPNLGVVDLDKKSSLLMADIPGLIAGASQGKGLGDEFLRHVERTSILIHLIDVYEDVGAAYKTIQKELKAYKNLPRTKSRMEKREKIQNSEYRDFGAGVDLSKKPQIVALNKIEGLGKAEVAAKIKTLKKQLPTRTPVFAVSAKSRENLDKLLFAALRVTKKQREKKQKLSKKPSLPVLRLVGGDNWQVSKKGKTFVVSGQKIERFASRTDFDNPEAVERLRDIMRKMGITHELARQGVKSDANIKIGQNILKW